MAETLKLIQAIERAQALADEHKQPVYGFREFTNPDYDYKLIQSEYTTEQQRLNYMFKMDPNHLPRREEILTQNLERAEEYIGFIESWLENAFDDMEFSGTEYRVVERRDIDKIREDITQFMNEGTSAVFNISKPS